MNNREHLKQLELLRVAIERLPKEAKLDCSMIRHTEKGEIEPAISLKRGIAEAAAVFGVDEVCVVGEGKYKALFFYVGPVLVVLYAPER